MNLRNMKHIAFSLSVLILVSAVTANANLPMAMFWRNRVPTLSFTTSTQTVLASLCSGVMTVRTNYANTNTAKNVSTNLTVDLSGSGGMTFYSDSNCSVAITSVTVNSGASTSSFYFLSTATGSPQVTASASGYSSVAQTETINTNGFIWTGGGADANWTTALNWSGGVAAGASNIAIFDGTCSSNCSPNLSANPNVKGVRMSVDYAGTITQASGIAMTIGTSGWVQNGGTFAGGDSSITMGGNVSLSGGIFTSTSGTMTVSSKNFIVSGTPTFNHHSGTLKLELGSSTVFTPGSIAFNHFNIADSAQSSASTTLTGTLTIQGDLTILSSGYAWGLIGTATINVSGNITNNSTSSNQAIGISITTRMVGGAGSNVTLSGVGGGFIGSLEIASAGTVNFANTGSIDIGGSFLYTSGTVVTTGSTVRFVSTGGSFTPGSVQFNHVTFAQNGSNTNTLTGTMTVLGDLILSATNNQPVINGGIIDVSGNVTASGNWRGGSTQVRLVGGVGSNMTLTSSGSLGYLPQIEIASAGTVNFASSVYIADSFLYTSGTVVTTGSTVNFVKSGAQSITPGTIQFNHVSFNPVSGGTNTLTGTMTVLGNLSFAASNNLPKINGGTINVSGNLSVSGSWNGGTTSLVLVGNGTQTLSDSMGTFTRFPGSTITVNSATSAVTLGSAVNLNNGSQNLTVTAGSVNLGSYALTIAGSLVLNGNTLTKNAQTLNVSGVTVGTGSLYGGTVNP